MSDSNPGIDPVASRTRLLLDIAALVSLALLLLVAALWHFSRRGSWLGHITPAEHGYLAAVVLEVALSIMLFAAAVGLWRRRRPLAGFSHLVLLVGAATLWTAAIARTVQHRQSAAVGMAEYQASMDAEMEWKLGNIARIVAAAQEDHRLRKGRFGALNELDLGMDVSGDSLKIEQSLDSRGWRITVLDTRTGFACALARDQKERPSSSREGTSGKPLCSAHADTLTQIEPVSDRSPARRVVLPPANEQWLQYRGDSAKQGRINGQLGGEWETALPTAIRASASTAGNVVVVGGHGTGMLAALSSGDGTLLWRTQVPNWIHQDPILTNNLVIVGFGDNVTVLGPRDTVLVSGRGPSGVSVHDRITGVRHWIQYERGSVMTSPVVEGDRMVYGTGSSELVSREVRSGKELWRRGVKGSVTMASPALAGNVVVVAQDDRFGCAYAMADGSAYWCYEFPAGYKYSGHSAPTIANGVAYFSAIHDSTGSEILRARSWEGKLRYVRDRALYRSASFFGGQALAAVDMQSGKEKWMSILDGGTRPYGHTSGTPLVSDGRVFVVAPVAQAVYALQESSGKVLWKHAMPTRARGPAVLIAEGLLVGDVEGNVIVLDRETGMVRCRYTLAEGLDRAGPALNGQFAIFAGLRGRIMSLPLTRLQSGCS